MGKLVFAAASFTLPCASNCKFAKKCAEKFKEGVCVDNVTIFTEKEIYGNPSEKDVRDAKIVFTTENPEGRVSISNGSAYVER
jgi:hypothetical protein